MSSDVTMKDRANALENEYFHRKEKEMIEKMKAKLAAENAEATVAACPKCDGNLIETAFEDIKIDVCNKCHGVWLDPGELAHITHTDQHKESWLGRLFG